MNKNIVTIGFIIISTIFMVLCITVFSILTIMLVKNESATLNIITTNDENYNKAVEIAEEQLIKILESKDYDLDSGIINYSVKIDENKQLNVEIQLDENNLTVLRWEQEYIGEWEDEQYINVWDMS